MAINKYIKQPLSTSSFGQYADRELLKIEKALNSVESFTEELLDMAQTEIGVWTPVLVGTTAAGVGTYSVQFGQYFKNGRQIVLLARLIWTAHTGTGNFRIDGLPYSLANLTNGSLIWMGTMRSTGLTTAKRFYTDNTAPNVLNLEQEPPAGVPVTASGDIAIQLNSWTV